MSETTQTSCPTSDQLHLFCFFCFVFCTLLSIKQQEFVLQCLMKLQVYIFGFYIVFFLSVNQTGLSILLQYVSKIYGLLRAIKNSSQLQNFPDVVSYCSAIKQPVWSRASACGGVAVRGGSRGTLLRHCCNREDNM